MPEKTTATWKIPYPTTASLVSLTPTEIKELIEKTEEILKARSEAAFETGDIKPSAVAAPQTGWLLCDGSLVNRYVYAKLFAVIGTKSGVGDGVTTFALPNLSGASVTGPLTFRVFTSVGNALAPILGVRSGSEAVVLDQTTSGVPAHTHFLDDAGGEGFAVNTYYAALGGIGAEGVGSPVYKSGGVYNQEPFTAEQSHTNMNPYFVGNWFIKT